MALNPIPVADAIANFIQSSIPTAGIPVTPLQLQTMWEGIITLLYNDIKTNAVITPNTFAAPTAIPVTVVPATGVGATTSPGPLTGTGKVT